jgi:hypothetical protein
LGAIAVIPNNPSRALKYPLDKHLYAQRQLVACCFSKLKQFRRVATRFEKTVLHDGMHNSHGVNPPKKPEKKPKICRYRINPTSDLTTSARVGMTTVSG